jgi:AbiU2
VSNVFDRYAGEGAEFLGSQRVCENLKRFKELAAKCEEYADRLIAHRDRRGISRVPTYKELDEALTCVNDLLKKYFLLIRGNTLKTVTPVFQKNWKVIFEQPWIREN